jgi:hypothetical protein
VSVATSAPEFRNEQRVKDMARGKKRSLLRALGVRASELDAMTLVYLDLTARALSKLTLLDQHYGRTGGIVREDGTGAPTLPAYISLLNTATRTARMLADHMKSQGEHRGEQLEDYIVTRYGNGDAPDE